MYEDQKLGTCLFRNIVLCTCHRVYYISNMMVIQ